MVVGRVRSGVAAHQGHGFIARCRLVGKRAGGADADAVATEQAGLEGGAGADGGTGAGVVGFIQGADAAEGQRGFAHSHRTGVVGQGVAQLVRRARNRERVCSSLQKACARNDPIVGDAGQGTQGLAGCIAVLSADGIGVARRVAIGDGRRRRRAGGKRGPLAVHRIQP